MPFIGSKTKTDSPEFQQNYEANRKLVDDLRDVHERIAQGGSERARKKHLSRGKLLPRDRVRKLVRLRFVLKDADLYPFEFQP